MIVNTEKPSSYDHLETMSTNDILLAINAEDVTVPVAVGKCIPRIEALVDGIVERMKRGGRVFYLGAGTSGRLGVTDASEIPPTYGVHDKFIGIIAGGDGALREAVEGAEDDPEQGWKDILAFHPVPEDSVVGISASGGAPYVVGALKKAREAGLLTACVCCKTSSWCSRKPGSTSSRPARCPTRMGLRRCVSPSSSRMRAAIASSSSWDAFSKVFTGVALSIVYIITLRGAISLSCCRYGPTYSSERSSALPSVLFMNIV